MLVSDLHISLKILYREEYVHIYILYNYKVNSTRLTDDKTDDKIH